MDQVNTANRIELFRAKIKDMSNEELIALSVLIRRGTLDLREEMLVLQEKIRERIANRLQDPCSRGR